MKGCTSVNITYQVNREIHILPITGDYVAFQDIVLIQGKEDSITEGISTLEKIATVTNDKEIPKIQNVYMFIKEIAEAHAKGNVFHEIESFIPFVIDKPFSHVEQYGVGENVLLESRVFSHNLYTLDGERLPHPIYFSDCNGLISNQYYDLEKILDKLKDDPNIIWTKNKRYETYVHSTIDGWGLQFRYLPTAEIWEKIKGINDSSRVREYLKKEVLGIEIFRKDEDEDS